MKVRSNVIEGNTFLGTIVPKSSIKGQFVPLQMRKSEQLVPLSAINDHFATTKHQGTFRFHQKEQKKRSNLFLLLKKRPFQNQEREWL